MVLNYSRETAECPNITYLRLIAYCVYKLYRAELVVMDLGWVDFDLNVPACCPTAQPIQPNSHLPKHNRAGIGMAKI